MQYLLESQNLSKSYAQSNVLSNISLHIAKGEFVSLMGPSGSGKSTLLYCLSGMDSVSSGSVKFDGTELSTLSEAELAKIRLKKMGFVFQQSNLLKNLSIFDNIVLGAYLAKVETIPHIQKRARELMSRMKIEELADRDITQASGGQLQRASICRALVNQPDILFGDEPTGALNSQTAHEILEILLELHCKGKTIFLATHDVKVAAKTERVLYILDGTIVSTCHLGKCTSSADGGRDREKKLSKWLQSIEF